MNEPQLLPKLSEFLVREPDLDRLTTPEFLARQKQRHDDEHEAILRASSEVKTSSKVKRYPAEHSGFGVLGVAVLVISSAVGIGLTLKLGIWLFATILPLFKGDPFNVLWAGAFLLCGYISFFAFRKRGR